MFLMNMTNKISNLTLDPLKAMVTGRSFALRATRLMAARRLAIHAVVIPVRLKLVTFESKSFSGGGLYCFDKKKKNYYLMGVLHGGNRGCTEDNVMYFNNNKHEDYKLLLGIA